MARKILDARKVSWATSGVETMKGQKQIAFAAFIPTDKCRDVAYRDVGAIIDRAEIENPKIYELHYIPRLAVSVAPRYQNVATGAR